MGSGKMGSSSKQNQKWRLERAMLSFKQMRNRVYDGKTCVRFECDIPVADDDIEDKIVTVFFTRYNKAPDGQEVWKCHTVMDATRIKDSDV